MIKDGCGTSVGASGGTFRRTSRDASPFAYFSTAKTINYFSCNYYLRNDHLLLVTVKSNKLAVESYEVHLSANLFSNPLLLDEKPNKLSLSNRTKLFKNYNVQKLTNSVVVLFVL